MQNAIDWNGCWPELGALEHPFKSIWLPSMGREACKAEIMAYKKTKWPITSVECSRNVGKGKLSKAFEMCKKIHDRFFPAWIIPRFQRFPEANWTLEHWEVKNLQGTNTPTKRESIRMLAQNDIFSLVKYLPSWWTRYVEWLEIGEKGAVFFHQLRPHQVAKAKAHHLSDFSRLPML